MPSTLFLASWGLAGLPDVLEDAPSISQLLWIPTAMNLSLPHQGTEDRHADLADMGFQIDELDLATATPARVEQAVAAADVIYVHGGNTYYLLHHMNCSGFREALAANDHVVYAGGSAGAIVACPDIAFIAALDDRSVVPELESTEGLGLVDFLLLPHIDNADFGDSIRERRSVLPADADVVELRDDQAVVVRDGKREIVDSPLYQR